MRAQALRRIGLALGAVGIVYGLLDIRPATALYVLAFVTVCVVAASCLSRDSTEHGIPLATDWAWFIAIGWPFVWVWYARRTRRSWLTALGFAVIPIAVQLGVLVGVVVRIVWTFAYAVVFQRER